MGELTLQVWETPGHADGHLSFLMRGGDRTYLIGADLVFWGGRILLQNIHDCRIDAYAASVPRWPPWTSTPCCRGICRSR